MSIDPLFTTELSGLTFTHLLVLLAVVIFLVGTYHLLRPADVPKSLPGPGPRFPLFGVALTVDYDWTKWPTKCLELSRRYGFHTWGGPTINIGFGPAFFVVLSEENVRHILRDRFEDYAKGGPGRGCLRELFGNVLFGADGELWRLHRSVVLPSLSGEAVRKSFDLISHKLDGVCSVLESMTKSTGSKDDKERRHMTGSEDSSECTVDLQDIFMRMTMDIAMEVTLGVNFNSVEDGDLLSLRNFMAALDELALLSHDRFQDLLYQPKQFFCFTEREKKIRKCASVVANFVDRIVRQIKELNANQDVGADSISDTNILNLFSQHCADADQGAPTDLELRNMVMNVVFAGRETTACALTWLFYELSKHPKVLTRTIEDIQTNCGTGKDAVFSYDNINDMKYVHSLILEVLRLHPPVTDDWRMAKKDDILPDGTHIPAGSCVMYSPYTMGHSEAIWGGDAEEFCPERFLDAAQPSAYKLIAFNAGPRICPGRSLALLEMKLAIAKLLTEFSFIDVQGHSGDYTWALVLSMKGGFPVSVRKV